MSATATRGIVDQRGQVVRLGPLLGKGGEGAVYEVAGDASRVAKLYLNPLAVNTDKLQAMVALSNPSLSKISAWPERTLHASTGAPPIGFVMPRASGLVLEELLGPGARKLLFPEANYKFVVRTAANLARAFATTHAAGAVIGDVKEINQFVSRDAIVTLVDTDGFQIRDPRNGKLFLTTAITPTHQPPELQGITNLATLLRTPAHDAFGLAVLTFQLLFMGRHPFAGIPVGRQDLEIPDAIKRMQFAWAPNLPGRLLQQPPQTLALSSVGALGDLFLRAFLPSPGGRPTAVEWATQLAAYEGALRACAANPTHAFIGSSCPLCAVELQVGRLLFLGVLGTPGVLVVFDVAAIWRQIAAIASPGHAPVFPIDPKPTPTPAAAALGRVRRRQKVVAVIVVLLGMAAVLAGMPFVGPAAYWAVLIGAVVAWIVLAQGSQDKAAYDKARTAARERADGLRKRWTTEAGDAAFQQRISALVAARDALKQLEDLKAQQLTLLRQTVRDNQLARYLQGQRLTAGLVRNIGPSKITALRAFNIETAGDITEQTLRVVPTGYGIGAKAKTDLLFWRDRLIAGFRYDATRGVDPRDIAALDRDFAARRAQHEQLLRLGPLSLKQTVENANQRRLDLWPQLVAVIGELAQADANAAR
jgi:DNA-binding helix-hairpin-helix protein with protein kinase domain